MRTIRSLSLSLSLCAACGATPDADPADADPTDVTPVDVLSDVVSARDAMTDAARDAAMTDAARDVMTDAVRDAMTDAARDAPMTDAARDVSPQGPVLYPADRLHAPITASVAAGLRALVASARGEPRVFAKVGASNTVNSNFLHCFAGTSVNLGGRESLRATLDHFRAGDAAGTDPYRRASVAATVGWSAWAAVSGTPSPLQRELTALSPRYAVVMFGTNDIQSRDIHRHGQSLLDIADLCVARGVIPIFTSVPPRDDDAEADRWVPRFTAVVRGVAQARQVPFVDLERALRVLPAHGLGGDGIHMNTFSGAGRACALTPEGLRYGFNTRNLLTLEALDRVRRVLDGGAAPDATAATLEGRGSADAPYLIPSLPFADARDTRREGARGIDRYTGCMSAADESGPEVYYRFTVRDTVTVRALVLARDASDIDLHLLRGTADGARCVARHDRMFTATLTPGEWLFSLDSYVSQGVVRAGAYVFVLMRE